MVEQTFMSILIDSSIVTLMAIFWTILFLQSSLDKVFDWDNNLDWLKGHFSKTPLASFVKPMLAFLTLVEFCAGLMTAIGLIIYWVNGDLSLLTIGILLSSVSLLMLFFGQRLAKDYPGAQTIAIYFTTAIICIIYLKYI